MIDLSGFFYVRISEDEVHEYGDGDYQRALNEIFSHTGIEFIDVTDTDGKWELG